MVLIKKRLKKNNIKLLSISLCLLVIFMFLNTVPVNAAAKRNETIKSFFFTSPRGQTASARVRATINETYSSSGSISTFTYRDCFLCYNRAYTASVPTVISSNGVHKTSATGSTVKTFSPWTRGDYLWEVSQYPNGGGSYNQTSVSYPKSTTYVSGFPYTVYCSGTLFPTQAGSVYVSLNTN